MMRADCRRVAARVQRVGGVIHGEQVQADIQEEEAAAAAELAAARSKARDLEQQVQSTPAVFTSLIHRTSGRESALSNDCRR